MKRILKKFFSVKALIIYSTIIVLGGGGFLLFGQPEVKEYETVEVTRGEVLETVTATGQIKPKISASLRFKISGTVSQLLVDVGSPVKSGQLLARIDDSALLKKLTQAQAEVNTAKVLLVNASENVSDTIATNEESLNLLYSDAPNSFSTVLNLSQQAYSSYVTFFDASNNRLILSIENAVPNSQLALNANNSKLIADSAMAKVNDMLRSLPSVPNRSTIDSILLNIHDPLQTLQTSLAALVDAVNAIPVGVGLISDSTLTTYKATLATAKTNLNLAVTTEIDLGKNIRNTKVTNTANLNTAQAAEREAEANLEKVKATLSITERDVSDAYLKSPIDGVVAVKDREIGELVTTAEQVYYIIDGNDLEVVSNVPEVDVARIRVGGEVEATLDALSPNENFKALITSIEPDQTTIDGVVHYKTHFRFEKEDPRFKSGMSVNLTMITNKKNNVLMVPRRAVTEKNGVAQVRILDGEIISSKNVTIGLKGDSAYEITAGLTLGDHVIVAEKVKK